MSQKISNTLASACRLTRPCPITPRAHQAGPRLHIPTRYRRCLGLGATCFLLLLVLAVGQVKSADLLIDVVARNEEILPLDVLGSFELLNFFGDAVFGAPQINNQGTIAFSTKINFAGFPVSSDSIWTASRDGSLGPLFEPGIEIAEILGYPDDARYGPGFMHPGAFNQYRHLNNGNQIPNWGFINFKPPEPPWDAPVVVVRDASTFFPEVHTELPSGFNGTPIAFSDSKQLLGVGRLPPPGAAPDSFQFEDSLSLFSLNGKGPLKRLATLGSVAPGLGGQFKFGGFNFGDVVQTNNGFFAFQQPIVDEEVIPPVEFQVIFADLGTGLAPLILQGDSAPVSSGAGKFTRFFSSGSFVGEAPSLNSDGTYVFRATNADAEGLRDGIWAGAPNEALERIIRTGDPTLTSAGTYNFSRFNRPQVNLGGDIFFGAVTLDVSDPSATAQSSLWSFDGNQFEQIAESGRAAPHLSDASGNATTFGVFDGMPSDFVVNAKGQIAFKGRLKLDTNLGITPENNAGIWATDEVGNLALIAREGVELKDKLGNSLGLVDSIFFNDGDYPGFDATSVFKGKGSNNDDGRPSGLSDLGDIAFAVTLKTNAQSPVSDAMMLRASFAGQQFVNEFFYSNACANLLWRGGCPDSNWVDSKGIATGRPPGDEDGTETATIRFATVKITGRPVILKKLDAGGSLTVQQPLTLKEASSIAGLILRSDLKTDGVLTLEGLNTWEDGAIGSTDPDVLVPLGDSKLLVGPLSALDMKATASNQNKQLNTNLTVQGDVVLHDANGTAGALTLGKDVELVVGPSGEFEMRGSTVVGGSGNFALKGKIRKTPPPPEVNDPSGGTGNISTPMQINDNGLIDVQAGRLVLTGKATHTQAKYLVAKNATLEFSGATTNVFKVDASGDGKVQVSSGTYQLDAGATATFNMNGVQGGNLVIGTATPNSPVPRIELKGTLRNDGSANWNSGEIKATGELGEFENSGTLLIRVPKGVKPKLDTLLVNLSDPQDSTKGGRILQRDSTVILGAEGRIINQRGATYRLSNSFLNAETNDVIFQNDGTLISSGWSTLFGDDSLEDGEAEVQGTLINNGLVQVEVGILFVEGNGIYEDARFELAEEGTLWLRPTLSGSIVHLFKGSSVISGKGIFSASSESKINGALFSTRIVVSGRLKIDADMGNFLGGPSRNMLSFDWVIKDGGVLSMPNESIRGFRGPNELTIEGTGTSDEISLFDSRDRFTIDDDSTLRLSGVRGSLASLVLRGNLLLNESSSITMSTIEIQKVTSFRWPPISEVRIEENSDLDLTQLVIDADSLYSIKADGELNVTIIDNRGTGTISGTVNGQQFNSSGELSGGNSPGVLTLNFEQFVQQSEGTLLTEIGGRIVGDQYDQVNVSGASDLDGTLDVRFLDRFIPASDDRFTVFTSALGISGRFSNTDNNLLKLTRGTFDIAYNDTSIEMFNFRLNGDFNQNSVLDVDDIDQLISAVSSGANEATFDVNSDGSVDQSDLETWVQEIAITFFGDANLDGEFNSSDLSTVLAAGQYDDDIAGNSGWAEGDWTADGDFTSADLVVALADGGFGQGPRVAAAAVPEPSSAVLLCIGLLAIAVCVRRHSA